MTGRKRRSTASLVVLLIILLLCIWMLYKMFIGLPPAPAPKVEQGRGASVFMVTAIDGAYSRFV
jgi:cytosine/uracil/thiamine/allantoin permease